MILSVYDNKLLSGVPKDLRKNKQKKNHMPKIMKIVSRIEIQNSYESISK